MTVFTSLFMVCFSAMFFKDFTTWGLLWILNLFIKFEKHFSHYFFRFSLCLLQHHMYWKHFFLSVLPHFPGASVKGISGCLLLPRSSLMLCPCRFVHPFSPASHFRVFICYQVSFFPCSVQFPFNLISIFLISDAAVHPRKFDLSFCVCLPFSSSPSSRFPLRVELMKCNSSHLFVYRFF